MEAAHLPQFIPPETIAAEPAETEAVPNIWVVPWVDYDAETLTENTHFRLFVDGRDFGEIEVDFMPELDKTRLQKDGSPMPTGRLEAFIPWVESELVERYGYLQIGADAIGRAIQEEFPDVVSLEGRPITPEYPV